MTVTDENSLLDALRGAAATIAARRNHPPVDAAAIDAFERAVDLQLPALYRRILSEIANGGFGPGNGIMGIPPHGFVDSDLYHADISAEYLEGRASDEAAWRTPLGLLSLCSWGCGIFSYIDTLSPDGPIITDEAFQDRVDYFVTSASLFQWLSDWVNGVDLQAAMNEVTAYRNGTNPFTGKPMSAPIVRRRGTRLDVSRRG